MGNIGYFDCFSGISGDMVLGAFVDLGVPVAHLCENLERLPLKGFHLSASQVFKHGIGAVDIQVLCDGPGPSRMYADILSLIQQSPLSDRVKRISLAVFEKMAEAEAAIHGCPKAEVHFHEVGGIDAIVDIVGAALCVEYLDLHRMIGSKVPLGRGFVSSRHGTLPLPAPAAIAILKQIPICGTPIDCELVTPTGAAILSTLCDTFQEFPDMMVEKIGYGAGKREIASQPNLLRVVMGRETRDSACLREANILVVEAQIDDMNPEIYGYLMDRLFDDGALDVFWTPIQMKKNRPGTLVTVICALALKRIIIDRLLSETTTLGVRSYPVERQILAREIVTVNTALGPLEFKRVSGPDGVSRLVPEFESCKTVALKKNMPLKEVYRLVNPQP